METLSMHVTEAQYRAIVDTAVDCIVVIDEHGIIRSFNRAAETIFGYTAEEIVGRNVKMLMPEPYHTQHDGYIAAYRNTGQRKIIGIGREVVGQRKDGTTFPMELSIAEWREEGQRFFTGIVRDITERKQAEGRLRDSEAKTRAILETAADGIITIDEHGSVRSANPAAERLFGYRAEEMIGHNVNML